MHDREIYSYGSVNTGAAIPTATLKASATERVDKLEMFRHRSIQRERYQSTRSHLCQGQDSTKNRNNNCREGGCTKGEHLPHSDFFLLPQKKHEIQSHEEY